MHSEVHSLYTFSLYYFHCHSLLRLTTTTTDRFFGVWRLCGVEGDIGRVCGSSPAVNSGTFYQPARTAPVDGANLDLRSAPLRRSTYPLPPRLLFALTSEPQDNKTQPQAPLPAYTQTSFLIPTLPSLRRPWLGDRVETLRPRLKRGPTANSPPERA